MARGRTWNLSLWFFSVNSVSPKRTEKELYTRGDPEFKMHVTFCGDIAALLMVTEGDPVIPPHEQMLRGQERARSFPALTTRWRV